MPSHNNSNDDSINSFLEQHDAYILSQARRQVPRNIFAPEVIDLEADDLAQETRIKLWKMLCTRPIDRPRPYIKTVVHNEAVNATRQHRQALPLPFDADGELHQECIVVRSGEDTQDPALILEQKEMVNEYITGAVHDTLTLPPCQQTAMICFLKEELDDTHLLAQKFSHYGINIDAIDWPQEKEAAHRSKASLTTARKKLRCLRDQADSR